MNISIEHGLNIIQIEVEDFVYKKMQDSQVSAGLMEKILEGILCQIRKLKNQDLERLIIEMNKNLPEIYEEKVEEQTASIKGLEEVKGGNLQSENK